MDKPLNLRGERPAYLRRAIDPGAAPASTVHLRMHGEIRLRNKWKPFTAEERIHHRQGFVWKARVGILSGADALIDGVGTCNWRLLGLIPLVNARGPDINRSATGRWLAESILLPSMLLPESGAVWEGSRVTLRGFGESATLALDLDADGTLKRFSMLRWGNPGALPFAYHPFGGIVEEEARFDGHLIPSRILLGWHFGAPQWEEGQFFRMSVDQAEFH